MVERTFGEVMTEFFTVSNAGRALEQEYMDRPTKELERKCDRLEKGWDKFLSNTKLKGESISAPRSRRAIAAKPSTSHGSTKRLPRSKRLRSE
jgi:hypothetical protein